MFGAGGTAGSRVTAEAVDRGHRVTAAVRRPEATSYLPAGVRVVTGDATSARSVRELAPDADAIVVAIGGGERGPVAGRGGEPGHHAARNCRPRRGSSTWAAGRPCSPRRAPAFLDEPDFPAEYRDSALGQADALDYYRTSADGVTWTYVSPPPLEFHPGERTGHYRTGTDQPVTDDQGRSVLTYEDLAVAIVDEIENPRHENARFTAAY